MPISEDMQRRPKRGYCGSCGKAFFTLGMRSHWVPHDESCPRVARLRKVGKNVEAPAQPLAPGSEAGDRSGASSNPGNDTAGAIISGPAGDARSYAPAASTQSTEEQDRERAALSDLDAPFLSLVRWPEGPSALSDMVREKPQRRRKW